MPEGGGGGGSGGFVGTQGGFGGGIHARALREMGGGRRMAAAYRANRANARGKVFSSAKQRSAMAGNLISARRELNAARAKRQARGGRTPSRTEKQWRNVANITRGRNA